MSDCSDGCVWGVFANTSPVNVAIVHSAPFDLALLANDARLESLSVSSPLVLVPADAKWPKLKKLVLARLELDPRTSSLLERHASRLEVLDLFTSKPVGPERYRRFQNCARSRFRVSKRTERLGSNMPSRVGLTCLFHTPTIESRSPASSRRRATCCGTAPERAQSTKHAEPCCSVHSSRWRASPRRKGTSHGRLLVVFGAPSRPVGRLAKKRWRASPSSERGEARAVRTGGGASGGSERATAIRGA